MNDAARPARTVTARSADGAQIACEVTGDGPVLVMTHGTGDTRVGFRRVAPVLAERFTVCLMDRRGRGISGDREAYALEREMEDVAAMAEAFDAPINLFAHSLGGVFAIEGAMRTKNIRRLMLYEPPIVQWQDEARRALIDKWARLIEEGNREGVILSHLGEYIRAQPAAIERARARPDAWAERLAMAHTIPRELLAMRGYDFRPEKFAGIGIPVRLLVGSESPDWARNVASRLREAIPGSDIVTLPGERHFAMITAPELLAAEITRFFLGD
jgi:pimeloyl-ACP methyl ester carboxylesterase